MALGVSIAKGRGRTVPESRPNGGAGRGGAAYACGRRLVLTDARSRSPFLSPPSTAQGRKAGLLFAVAAALVVLGIGLAGLWFGLLEEPGGDQESPPLPMVIPMFLAALGGFVAAISGGVYAVMAIRRGDRSAILALPLIAFLLALTFIVGEFAVPH